MFENTLERLIWHNTDINKIFMPIKAHFYLYHYINKNAEQQLYLSVSSHGIRKRIPLGLYMGKHDFNKLKQKYIGSDNDKRLLFDSLKAKITKIEVQYRLNEEPLTIHKFIHEFKSSYSRVDFIQFFKNMLEEEKTLMTKGYYLRCKSVLTKLEKFQSQIYFSEIDVKFINKFKKYCVKNGNKQNTIVGNLRVIKKYLRTAEKNGIKLRIDLEEIKTPEKRGCRTNLNPTEVKKFWDFYFSDFRNSKYDISVGVFLFSCFTSLRISDMENINREVLLNSNVYEFQVVKTKKFHQIKLNSKSNELLLKEPKLFVNWISREKINEHLKEVANILGIKKNVSLHVGRHTFATNYLKKGGKVENLQKILNHSDIKETMIYVHIVRAEADETVYLLDDLW